MTPTALLFTATLLLTIALLGGAVATGLRALRRFHLSFVAGAFLCLALTIVLALRVGKEYDLEAAGWITPVHLNLARIATFSFVLPVATGIRTIRNPKGRGIHRVCAFISLGLTVLAALTGAWMLLAAEPY